MRDKLAGHILRIVLLALIFLNPVFGEDKPKLRWVYKYREGEVLMYELKGREWGESYGIFKKGYEKEIEGVLSISVKNEIGDGKQEIETWTQIKRLGG